MADSQNLGTTDLRYPTDYNLKTLNLITSLKDGVVNLMPFLIELNLFEDLYSPTISGEIVLQDAVGLISNYNLIGSEFIQVQLQKTTEDSIFYSRNFRVYKVGTRAIGDSNQYEVFTLQFCSEEFILSEQYRISKSFKGTDIATIVNRIFSDYLLLSAEKTKPVVIEDTSGVYDFILPNKKIFETINWLTNYAQTTESRGDFVFFENSEGYFFVSLASLFQTHVYANYKFDPKNIMKSDIEEQLRNVSDFEVLNFFDTLSGVTNGTFSNKVMTLNPLLREANTTAGVFSYADHAINGVKLNDNPIINNYQNRHGDSMYDLPTRKIPGLEVGCLRMVSANKETKKSPAITDRGAEDYVANDIMIERVLPQRVSKMALTNYTRIKVTIPGDPNLTVGKVVHFSTFKIQPVTFSDGDSSRDPDPFYTGKYLVTAVRHIVKNNSYITIMEMCKDSHTGDVSGVDTSNSTLKSFVNGEQA